MDINDLFKSVNDQLAKIDGVEHKTPFPNVPRPIVQEKEESVPIPELLEQIKSGSLHAISIFSGLSCEDLLKKDEQGITYFEYALMNDIILPYSLEDELANNKDNLLLFIKYNHIPQEINEDILFSDVDNNKKIIDLIFEKNKYNYLWISQIENHHEIFDYLNKYDISSFQLSFKMIEDLFENNNGSFLIDKYLNKPNFILNIIRDAPISVVNEYCKIRGDYSIFKYSDEKELLRQVDNNETILEKMLDSGSEPLFSRIIGKDAKTLNIFVKKNRFDLLYKMNIELLLTSYDADNTYFDLMVNAFKQGTDVHFEYMSFNDYRTSSETKAQMLTVMAKNGLIGYVPSITPRILLNQTNGKTVLEHLIEIDKDLALNTIIPSYVLHDREIAFELKKIGVEETGLRIDSDKSNVFMFSDEIVQSYNENYDKGYKSENEDLLEELKDLFMSDGKSDSKAIEALVTSYRYLTSVDIYDAVSELEKLIEIKRLYPDFSYDKSYSGSFFSPSNHNICIESPIIEIINHETTHALHYFLTEEEIPDGYEEMIQSIRDNPQTIGRVQEYSKKFANIVEQVKQSISEDEISQYYDSKYVGASLLDLAAYLALSKDDERDRYKDDFPKEVLETILSKSYSVDEYISQQKKLAFSEVLDTKLRNEYASFTSIGDIIDAIYIGKFQNGVLRDDIQETIAPTYGHGISYYQNPMHGFDEILANYGTIIKSKNSEETISILRYIVGNELVDTLDDFYMNKLLKSNVLNKDDVEEEHSHAR